MKIALAHLAKLPVRLFLCRNPLRAWLEMLAMGLGLLLILLPFSDQLIIGDRQNGTMIVILVVVTLYALRLRFPHGPWWTRLVYEILLGCGLVLLLGGLLYALSVRLANQVANPASSPGLPALTIFVLQMNAVFDAQQSPDGLIALLGFVILLATAITFVVTRIGIRVWLVWRKLQREHLIWALAQSHLMLVALAALFYSILIIFNNTSYLTAKPGDPASALLVLLKSVSLFTALGIITVIGILIVLPPAAVISYFVIRQTTRRLNALTKATGAIRAGDYGVRVARSGGDEVTQLQIDFNAMAADLERAMHDLQAERDAVATVLRSRRELVASVSHELRTPVAILRGYLESALARWDTTLPPDLRHDIEVMEQETGSLQRLIDDLFALSRAEVGKLDLRLQATDVVTVIHRVIDADAPILWKTNRVEVINNMPGALPHVMVDELRLEQVIHNLLRNAVRHTPPGGLVAVTARQTPHAVVVQVKDTGEGIAPADLPHIWEPFYRAESTRLHDHSGAGLGLALVKQLVEAMGGSVQAESTVGQGSCFSVHLALSILPAK